MSLTAPTSVAAFDMATGTAKWTQPVGIATTPRFLGTDKDTVYVLGGKLTTDMTVHAYTAKDGTHTEISTVTAPDGLLPPGLVMDYNSGNLSMIEPGSGTLFGAITFRPSGT
ncbi:hypothetical protein [Streptomyces sp. NPDC059564]|uniref:hypothetical protein n=1 Tax=Streptomyces sp. NPDC059564 TaxID=3346865 RepID=UPI0036B85964